MKQSGLLYFALGVTTVISIGAVTNQLLPAAPAGVALSGTGITFPDGTVQTTAAPSDARRGFYLTFSTHKGGPGTEVGPLNACESGYHMASIYEILDPSNLRYATEVANAATKGDSGQGPPQATAGWVRTGDDSSFSSAIHGLDNCSVWSQSAVGFGTMVGVFDFWNGTTATTRNAPWASLLELCSGDQRVWCVEDYPGSGG